MADDLALDTRKEADATPQKAVRRWLLEIKLAQKREKNWREKARSTLKTYRGTDRKKNSFNILWANTEVLRPALYNSPPKPDVRRRFRQDDPLGKAVSEVMERGVSYCVDAYDLDNVLQNDVIDALLPGRGVSRIRYVPKFKQIPSTQSPKAATPGEVSQSSSSRTAEGTEQEDAFEGEREEVEYEQALCDHVQWDDFLHGPGKTWEEVQWEAFRARLSRDDLIEQFGEDIGNAITLNDVDDSELNEGHSNEDLKEVFKRAELWEIWDKGGGKVFFINESYRKGLIYPLESPKGEPPLALKNFFPTPRPLQLFEDTGSLIPTPLYEQYREQAEELDRLSARINKIVNACRVRFVHDSTLTELAELMKAGDNEGIPAQQARAWMTNGGIEKAIWWMPIDKVAQVLKELYVARDAAKQAIFEITGLSDILRGATDPNETLGAQKLKANSSSLRLQRMVTEVQRYTRDLIRLLAEVIGENFDVQTLAQMTGLQFPTAQQKQMVQLQMQAAQQMMAQPGAQPPPEVQQKMAEAQKMLAVPSWEDIKAVLSNDMQREYRVDVETDSTVAQSLQQDMEGIREVITAIIEFWQGVGPAVQAQAVSIEAVKAITMSIVRRARMGLEVEDAIEAGLQEPKQQGDPKAQAEAQKAQIEQQKAAHDAQLAQQQQAHDQALAKAEEDRQRAVELAKHQREQDALQAKAALEAQKQHYEAQAEDRAAQREDDFNRWKAELEARTKIEVAEISAGAALDAAEIKAANAGVEGDAAGAESAPAAGAKPARPKRKNAIDKLAEMHAQTMEAHGKMVEHVGNLAAAVAAPRKAVRDKVTGRISGSVVDNGTMQ